jgi:single-strand DNA-binding protein
MSDINQVTIVGRLIRDPEVRFAPTGTVVASFSLAANHAYQDKSGQWKDEVAFVPCAAFGQAAQALAQKHKGEPLLAVGRLKTETWNKDGVNHSRLVLMVQAVQMVQHGIKTPGAVESPETKTELEQARSPVPF